MIRNFFKIAWRNLLRNKGFSFINIFGLAVGMGSTILILLWIQNEISHERFHKNLDRIYTLNNRDKFNGELWAWNTTPKILAPTLQQDYPEVEEAVRITRASFLMSFGDKHLIESGNFIDPSFLKVFSFPLIQGNAAIALNQVHNIVVTQKFAKKFFGNEDAVGKIIRIDSSDNFTVTGVMKDLPNNTSFDFEYLLPWSYMNKIGWNDSSWGNNSIQSYVLLKPGVSQSAFNAKIKNVTIDHTKGTGDSSTTQVFTQPLKDQWLYSKSENGKYVGGRVETVRLFGIIAAFILLIACINFMNLSTARSEKRAKEVGIRKVVGAQKRFLITQFVGESVLLALFAFVLALVMVEMSLPSFNNLVGKKLFIDFGNVHYWLFALAFIFFTGILAGSYPAFYLSSYKPVKVLKGTFKASHALITPRKILVVLQFTFAIALIICTMIVEQQINYAQNRDTGYVQDQLAYTFIQGDVDKHYESIRSELMSSGAVLAVSKSMSPITQQYSDGWGWQWTGSTQEDLKTDFVRMASDADFVKTMGTRLIEGRDIDVFKYPTDSSAMLLNEAAVKAMHLKNPVGTIVNADGGIWHVVGILKDFIYRSPYEKVQQLAVLGPKSWFNVIHFKLNPNNTTEKNLQAIQTIFKKYNPQYPFDYKFADESYAVKFRDEQRIGTLAALFAGLTILISCLGLFGLATYMAENRIKEVGVRKVLGASVLTITALLSKDFLKLVVISLVIASPVAWWAMSMWLEKYTYRVNIGWWVFALAGLLSVAIALITVSYQSIKAAIANPVKSLRTE